MKKIAMVAMFALLGGCSASVDKMGGPNGEKLLSVNCSARFQDWGSCMKAVSETCGDLGMGYRILQRNAEKISGSYSYVDSNTGLSQSSHFSGNNRQLFAVCVPIQSVE